MISIHRPKALFSCLLGALFLVLLGTAAHADDRSEQEASEVEDSEVIQEVFLGELPWHQEEGELQVTSAIEIGDDETEVSLGFEWGLGETLSTEIEIEGVADGDETGPAELELGLRYATTPSPDTYFTAGLALGYGLDSVEETTKNSLTLAPSLAFGRDVLDRRAHLFANLALEWVLDEGDGDTGSGEEEGPEDSLPEDQLEVVIGGFLAMPWGAWTFELAAEWELEDTDEMESRAVIGVVMRLGDDWQIGVAGALGLDDEVDDALLLSLSFED